MSGYLIRAKDNPEVGCKLEYVDFQVRVIAPGREVRGESGENEVGITILTGACDIEVDGQVFPALGGRAKIREGCSPHVALIPPGCAYSVRAVTAAADGAAEAAIDGGGAADGADRADRAATGAKVSIAATPAGGGLEEVTHIPQGSIPGARRGTGKTQRTIYDLIPPEVDTKLMIYEVFTPEGNWSSFPPHKHDEETADERLLQEVYLFDFDPPEGFALIWLFDDDGALDEAYAAKSGDLELIPKGYHTMCVSPGYTCSTHAVMAGPTNEWKIKFKEEYKHLFDWDR